MNPPPDNHRQPDQKNAVPATSSGGSDEPSVSDNYAPALSTATIIPAFEGRGQLTLPDIRVRFTEACAGWLSRSASAETRSAYTRELQQFLRFVGIPLGQLEQLGTIRPHQVAAWRDRLHEQELANSSIVRKMTVLRSLFSYLQVYGYAGANPAHSDFVKTPAVPRDGKTVGLSAEDCRR